MWIVPTTPSQKKNEFLAMNLDTHLSRFVSRIGLFFWDGWGTMDRTGTSMLSPSLCLSLSSYVPSKTQIMDALSIAEPVNN